ncbi:MAG TPA: SusD/RagB family nutrient-binding outer membrane lipoprotein [Puia sp.]|jgi:hypothetical protein
MKKLTIISLSLGLLASACTKNLTKLNNDPKSAVTVPSRTLFTKGEKDLSDLVSTTSVSTAPFRVLAQEWTENTYVYEAQYNFAAYQAQAGFWNTLYSSTSGVINNLQQAKLTYPTDVSDPVALRNDLIITDILEVYAYYMLTATYGDIPYTQSENKLIPFPAYDDAKTVYTDLLLRLDSCIAGINTSGAAMGAADLIYGGNLTTQCGQWKKFAATLKLKVAMLAATADAATAGKKAGEAVATGVFASAADNALFSYDAAAVGNSNPIWQALVNGGRHDFLPTNLLVNTMLALNDPRVPIYFKKDPNGNYTGGQPGGGNGYGINSDFGAIIQTPAYPGNLLDYSQSEFLQAEAVERGFTAVTGTAESHYNNAITASIVFWGGTTAQAATYLAQASVAYTTATGPWQQKIGYQEWIANYNHNWDAWTDIRRLGYPNLNVVSPPTSAQGNLPLRLTYPANEVTSNSVNWGAAAKKLPGGIDAVSAKLWWEQ